MPGPGGGSNSGGFGGGIYTSPDDSVSVIPELNFDTLVDLFVNIQNTFAQLWLDLNKPAYYMIQDILNGDGDGILSKLVDVIFDSIAVTGFDTFLNRFTLLEFLFGSGLITLISLNLLKFFKR